MSGLCSVDDCERPSYARTWCRLHYHRWRRQGDPLKVVPDSERAHPVRDITERFWAKVEKTATCWVWTGATKYGYGVIGVGRRTEGTVQVHRLSYELHTGPIPEGLQIDHLCFNTACVNPDHLEAVTQQVNLEREHARRAGR